MRPAVYNLEFCLIQQLIGKLFLVFMVYLYF